MEAREKGRYRKQEVVKTSKKQRGIPQYLLARTSLFCGFCYPIGVDKDGNPLTALKRGQYKKQFKTHWHLKCHVEYHHRGEFRYDEIIADLRRGAVPNW